jgi:hypothetical protein
MVTGPELPQISWEEDFSREDERRVSGQIVATITSKLTPPAAGCSRLYFFVPTPAPYTKAEAKLLLALDAEGITAKELRVLTLPHGGRCYVVSDENHFRTLLPHAFHLGPPELTFVVANCRFDISSAEEDIVNLVLAALRSTPSATQDIVGMHFDSGSLVELF